MKVIGIVGNGPRKNLPDLIKYKDEVDVWIGADAGAEYLLNIGLPVSYAVGDFDSLSEEKRKSIRSQVEHFQTFKAEKDVTDMEIAIDQAMDLNADKVYIFGATGGRLDHELINMQLLLKFVENDKEAIIVDKQNKIQLAFPGTYTLQKEDAYPYVSFIAFTATVTDLSLQNFRYPLDNKTIQLGTSLCISNEISGNNGTFSFSNGTLLIIKSSDQ